MPDPDGRTEQPGDRPGTDDEGLGAVESRPEYRPRHRKPSIDEVFGDVLPETTGDEREPRPSDGPSSRDDELRRDVPPHHG